MVRALIADAVQAVKERQLREQYQEVPETSGSFHRFGSENLWGASFWVIRVIKRSVFQGCVGSLSLTS